MNALAGTIEEIRGYALDLGAVQLVATMPTADGETVIDYRPGDWLKISVGEKHFVLPPDWSGP